MKISHNTTPRLQTSLSVVNFLYMMLSGGIQRMGNMVWPPTWRGRHNKERQLSRTSVEGYHGGDGSYKEHVFSPSPQVMESEGSGDCSKTTPYTWFAILLSSKPEKGRGPLWICKSPHVRSVRRTDPSINKHDHFDQDNKQSALHPRLRVPKTQGTSPIILATIQGA